MKTLHGNSAVPVRTAELALLFVAVPLAMALSPVYLPRLPLLLAGSLYALWRLYGRVRWRELFSRPESGWWKGPLLRAVPVAVFCTACVFVMEPEAFLEFPRQRPGLWLMVMVLYPLLSVLPQEIIYRVFLFEVHANLRNPVKWILISALLFGWVHCIYADIFAIWTSALAGLLLGTTYVRYRQQPGVLWRVLLEHSLYGQIVFTVGLGKYFFLARAGEALTR